MTVYLPHSVISLSFHFREVMQDLTLRLEKNHKCVYLYIKYGCLFATVSVTIPFK